MGITAAKTNEFPGSERAMSSPCRLCTVDRNVAFDAGVAGGMPLVAFAERFGIPKSNAYRHRLHLRKGRLREDALELLEYARAVARPWEGLRVADVLAHEGGVCDGASDESQVPRRIAPARRRSGAKAKRKTR